MSIVEAIRQALPSMPPLYRKIALYIIENDEAVGFSSVHAFAEAVGVSSATVVRFAKSLGLDGYAELKRSMQGHIKSLLGPYDKIALSDLDREPRDRQLTELRENEVNNLRKTLEGIDTDALHTIVSWITGAERVFACGFGVSGHMIQILGNAIASALDKPVVFVNGSVSDYIPRLKSIGPRDTLLTMTFPPYSPEAIQATELGKARGCKVGLFTDSPRCPAYPLADTVIRCENNSLLMANSYVGLIAVVQILANLLCLSDKAAAVQRLKELSELERTGYSRMATLIQKH